MTKKLSGDERLLRSLGFTISDPEEEAKVAAIAKKEEAEQSPAPAPEPSVEVKPEPEPVADLEAEMGEENTEQPKTAKSKPGPKKREKKAEAKTEKTPASDYTIFSVRISNNLLERLEDHIWEENIKGRKTGIKTNRNAFITKLIEDALN